MKKNLKKFLYYLIKGRFWLLKVILFATFLSLFISFPSYDQINFSSGRWIVVKEQINDPFVLLKTSPSGSENSLAFRIFIPILANLFKLSPTECCILQFFNGILLFYLVLIISFKLTNDKLLASLLVFCVAATGVGRTAFYALNGNFDDIAIVLILLTMISSNNLCISLLIIIAGFTDERAIIMSSLVILWFILFDSIENKRAFGSKIKKIIISRAAFVFYGMIIYIAMRYYLKYRYSFIDVNQDMLFSGNAIFLNQINNSAIGILLGLEGLWILVCCSIFTYYSRNKSFIMFYSTFISFIIVIALSTVDIGRSMNYLFPAVFIAIKILVDLKDTKIDRLIKYSTILSMIWPAYYVGGKSTIWWCYPLPLMMIRFILIYLGYDLDEI